MKKTITTLMMVILVITSSFSQVVTFQKKFNSSGYCIHQTTDGGYIANGYGLTSNLSLQQFYGSLIKLNAHGDTVWTKKYINDSIDFFGVYSEQTNDGGYIITGTTDKNSLQQYHIYLIKTDTSGNTIWTTAFSNNIWSIAKEVHQTTDGGYVVIGYTKMNVSGQENVYLVKTNSTGTVLWGKTFGGLNLYEGYSVKQTADGGYIIAGSAPATAGVGGEAYLIKTDSSGILQWTKTYACNSCETNAIFQTQDGGYLATGTMDIPTGTGAKGNVLLFKTDNSGDVLWAKKYADGKHNLGMFTTKTNDGGFVITGISNGEIAFQPYTNALLIKTDSLGNYQWSKSYGDTASAMSNDEEGHYVYQTSDNGYIISGRSTPALVAFTPIPNLYLIKTDANGNSGCKEYNLPMVDSTTILTPSTPPTGNASGVTNYYIPITITNGNDSIHTLCFNPTGIEEINNSTNIIIYPNPFTSQTAITFSEEQKNTTIRIIDLLGKEIKTINFTGRQLVIDKGEMQEGIYF